MNPQIKSLKITFMENMELLKVFLKDYIWI